MIGLHREHTRDRDALALAAREALAIRSSSRPVMFTAASASATRRSISAWESPRFSGPNATSAPTVDATNWSRGS